VNQYGPIALVLPTIVLATSFVGVVVRFARASMLEVLGQDYVRTARAKGLRRGRSSTGMPFGTR
jgi:ABC-type dipeptide/oligopeptide/nickel transport system permease component